MKYFLLPFTIIIWFLLTYYGIYFAVLGTIYIFSFNLFWIIVGGGILFGILFSISNEIPLILRYFILKLYGFNWLSCISHSLAGLVGVVFIIRLYILSPPVFVGESGETFIIKGMWEIAPLKTILVVLEFIGLVVSILYTTIIAPVFLIEERNNKENEISELIDFSGNDNFNFNITVPTAQNQILTDTPTPIKEKEDDSKIQFQKIKQKDFLIPATNKTPEVNFNNNGILWIKGRSIPENAYLFYSGLENWIEEYCHNPAKETSINIMLEYFNEGGYKNLLRILRNLLLLEDRGNFVIINWYYEKEDQDMKRTY